MSSFKPIILSVFFITLLTSTNTRAAEEAVVALFGDSVTAGLLVGVYEVQIADGRTDGVPTIELDKLLNQNTPRRPAVLSNWGHGGSSSGNNEEIGSGSSSGTYRISSTLDSLAASETGSPKIVLIIYGTNDFDYGISEADTGFNTSELINKSRTSGFIPIIGTLTPRSDRSVVSYNSAIQAAAAERGAALVDHYTVFMNYPDGGVLALLQDNEIDPRTNLPVRKHPNTTGYRIIAETWFDRSLRDLIPVSSNNVAGAIQLLLDDDN